MATDTQQCAAIAYVPLRRDLPWRCRVSGGGGAGRPGRRLACRRQIRACQNVGLYLDRNNIGLQPPWVMPDEAQELAACKRYWQLLPNFILSGYNGAGGTVFLNLPYPVAMRTTPALAGLSIVYSNMSGLAMNASSALDAQFRALITAAASGYTVCQMRMDARM
jgi:hypothetical protein